MRAMHLHQKVMTFVAKPTNKVSAPPRQLRKRKAGKFKFLDPGNGDEILNGRWNRACLICEIYFPGM
jgi:hypothetical protein